MSARPDITVGTALPPLAIDITAKLIVAGALASQDFEPVHHDATAARAAGTADIFMNILTTNGLVGRYLTDWAGPRARLQRLQLKLGAPNYPGDTMTLTGEVTETSEGGVCTVAFKGKNGLGYHVTGQAQLAWPESVA